jgi:hypothetical protein
LHYSHFCSFAELLRIFEGEIQRRGELPYTTNASAIRQLFVSVGVSIREMSCCFYGNKKIIVFKFQKYKHVLFFENLTYHSCFHAKIFNFRPILHIWYKVYEIWDCVCLQLWKILMSIIKQNLFFLHIQFYHMIIWLLSQFFAKKGFHGELKIKIIFIFIFINSINQVE